MVDVTTVTAQLEAAVANQVVIAGGDPAIEQAAEAVLAAIEPALRQSVLELAEQAAAEVAAQLPSHRVEVVLVEGEPSLRVTSEEDDASLPEDDYEARITLRLPERLKALIEESAGAAGDSVNAWVVKTVSSKVRVKRRAGGTRVTGTIDT